MERFTIDMSTTKAAFTDDDELDHDYDVSARREIVRILRNVADRLEEGEFSVGHSFTLFDINGNDVGRGKMHRNAE